MSVAVLTAGLLAGIATTVGPGLAAVAGHDVHIDAGGNLYPVSPAWTIAGNVTSTVALVSMLGWLALQVPRYRRAGAERRQQLKWLYSGTAVFVGVLLATALVPYAAGEAFGSDGPLANDTIELGSSVMLVCIAIAVLKYRLYAIDRIISRVISYLIITAVLAGVFAGLVLFATSVLPVKAPVAVAAATLAAAALFNPLRRRVQHAVDRRFNRTRYNAEAVVASFTAQLRQTVDLDTMQGRAIEHGAPRVRAGPRLDLVGGREQPLLDGPVRDEAPGAVEHRLPGRPRLPAEDAPGLLGGVPVAAAERRGDLP